MTKITIEDEIEAKFLNQDHVTVRQRLERAGATCLLPMRLMKRATFDNEFMKQGKDSFLRIRDEGNQVTMTYKQFDNKTSFDGAKEVEIVVSDFEKAVGIIEQTGLFATSIQESKRETWVLNGTEIVLDVWPWLKPYIEIEGKSKDDLIQTAESLQLNWNDAVFGDVMTAYRAEYPHLGDNDTVGNIPEVRFNTPLPALLISRD